MPIWSNLDPIQLKKSLNDKVLDVKLGGSCRVSFYVRLINLENDWREIQTVPSEIFKNIKVPNKGIYFL